MTPPITSTLSGQPQAAGARLRHAARHLLVGATDRPGWATPALFLLLAGTALLYLWALSASGYANSFYAAAVQAGTQSWKAFFFGSVDSANLITVDKPPASLWVMSLSGRLFGFSSWSMLAPQALEGVAAVGLLYAGVRRWFGVAAGLFAGAALALTPVAVLMFRFNNPDALLTLLLVAAAYCMVRAIEKGGTRWLLLAGAAIGFGFLTKMMQAFLVLPAFGLVYLVAAPTDLRRRVLQLFAAAGAVLVSAGWWVAIVQLWPASSRPYIGGSTTNSVLELALGYNGLARLFGGQGAGGGGGNAGNIGFGGAAGMTRLFGQSMGTEISWLLPAALIALAAGLWFTRRAPRTDRARAALLLWGGWLIVTGLVFSYMNGIIHPYYTVALAPAIAALVAIVGRELWRARHDLPARATLALMVAVTGVWDFVLLSRTASWHPEVRFVLLGVTALAVAGLLVGGRLRGRTAVSGLLAVVVFSALADSGAYALATAAVPHSGPIPASGPASTAAMTFPGPGGAQVQGGRIPGGSAPFGREQGAGRGPIGGGARAPGEASTNSALVKLLESTSSTWAAATVGSQSAAALELSSGKAVMAIGGFSGSDPAPTLAELERDVSAGKVQPPVAVNCTGSSQIADWVQSHFTATTVGGQTVYDLSQPAGG